MVRDFELKGGVTLPGCEFRLRGDSAGRIEKRCGIAPVNRAHRIIGPLIGIAFEYGEAVPDLHQIEIKCPAD